MKVLKTILNIIINILIVIVLVTSLVVAVLALTSRANSGVASILGYSFHTIQTSSMEGGSDEYEGGDYYPGDLVIGKTTGSDAEAVYEIGDIVVYSAGEDENKPDGINMIAHRIVDRTEDSTGNYVYTTKGDNNSSEDDATHYARDIVSVCYDSDYHGAVLKGVGGAMDYIRTGQGFFFVVLLPMIIFFMYEITRVVLNTLNYKKAKSDEEKEAAEREKQEAVEAAVKAVLEAQQASNAAAAVDPTPAAPAAEAPAPAPAAEAPAPAEVSAEQIAPAAETPAAPEMSAEDYEEFKRFMAFKKAQEQNQVEE